MAVTFSPKLEILPAAQRTIWPELKATPREFTLYGGTAIALQLGHRESIDFDFFGSQEFDPDSLIESVGYLKGSKVIQKSADTLTVVIDRAGPVQVSFFGVPKLKRITRPHIDAETKLQIASLVDLAGTKAAVVQKRAEAKDYLDLDAIIGNGPINLARALAAASVLYGDGFVPELTLKALCYFGDGNLAIVPDVVQKRLVKAVAAVDLGNLPDLKDESKSSKRWKKK